MVKIAGVLVRIVRDMDQVLENTAVFNTERKVDSRYLRIVGHSSR